MMRKRFCAALILLLLTTVLIFPCFAATFDFETEAISPQEQEALWDSLAFQWIEEPAKAVNFRCFAANEKGEYFLGFFGDPVWVLAYDVNGTYLYGFTLNNILSFALAWDSDADALMILQSDQIIWVDQNGNCLDMVSVPYSSEASQYTRTTQETYRAGNITLSAQRKFSNTFTRVVKTLPDGTEVILFDSSGRSLAGWSFGFLFIPMCVIDSDR